MRDGAPRREVYILCMKFTFCAYGGLLTGVLEGFCVGVPLRIAGPHERQSQEEDKTGHTEEKEQVGVLPPIPTI